MWCQRRSMKIWSKSLTLSLNHQKIKTKHYSICPKGSDPILNYTMQTTKHCLELFVLGRTSWTSKCTVTWGSYLANMMCVWNRWTFFSSGALLSSQHMIFISALAFHFANSWSLRCKLLDILFSYKFGVLFSRFLFHTQLNTSGFIFSSL